MLAMSIPLHEGGHYAMARLLGYESRVRLVLRDRGSGFWTVSMRLYDIRTSLDLEKAIRESLAITASGALGIVSPLAFLVRDPEAWLVFAGYSALLLSYSLYEVSLTARSWKYERLKEYVSLWWTESSILSNYDLVGVELLT